MRSLNESACQALLDDVRWDEPSSLASLAVLALINVLVIAGNCLVIAAVFCSSKLRSVTNLFIVSLAVADLLVGLAVLPFSATREVFEVWIFGDIWCSVWLAVDVWMCTASILNLCAISLDRYVAVTRPVNYPSVMSQERKPFFFFQVWIFGDIWCSVWLAVDVWMCTASILNLCAISLDRYVAVTRPVNYPSVMSQERKPFFFFQVWIFGDIWCSVWLAVDVWMCTASTLNLCAISLDRYVAVTRPVNYPSVMSQERKPFFFFQVWIFGDIWCSVWLAVDVWMCTASILNLCAISLDRYVAVTRPVNYPSVMSQERKPFFFFQVWIFGDIWCSVWLAVDVWMCTASILNLCAISLDRHVAVTRPVTYPSVMSQERKPFFFFQVWIFGDIWCSVWLAVDVWMCTASILNLCAISLDRYVAVTRPVNYPSIMSHKRAKGLIAGLWVLSFVICFPPLVGWKDQKSMKPVKYMQGNQTLIAYTTVASYPPCPWTCELTNDAGYVVYSALGSFYIPMFVMLFFYWRIYKAAVRTTKAINQGFRTTKGKGMGSRFDDNRLTLRIHRGRGSAGRHHGSPHSNGSNHSTTTSLGSASPERLRRHSSARRAHDKIKISVSYPSSEQICPNANNNVNRSPSPASLYAVHYTAADGRDLTSSALCYSRDTHLRVTSHPNRNTRKLSSRRSSSADSSSVAAERELSPSPSGALYDDLDDKPKATRRMGKRNIKAQVKRFRMETKAAKTLGIIVGGFVCCWLPFFTMYVVRAFCEECIHPLVFSILFWLGYCNSAINPLIYALFSKDFRFAFKRIICRCFCNGGAYPSTSRRGSDGSQMKNCRSPSCNVRAPSNSIGEESDPNHEASDSR